MKKNTKEEDIISFIESSGNGLTNKAIMERFNVNEQYIKSLKWRLKNKETKELPKFKL
jgi:transposase